MTILYLHGLLSSNQTPKVEYLKKMGHTVIHPKLDYNTKKLVLFSDLEKLIVKYKVNLIIGSSMGAYLGFYLANKHNLYTLLFNPSLQSTSPKKPNVEVFKNEKLIHCIVIGKNDTTVIPKATLKFLFDNNIRYTLFLDEHEHKTPYSVFVRYFNFFVERCIKSELNTYFK